MDDLQNTRALVTGGTKGIGAATARALERRGATVVIAARTAPGEPVGSTRFIAADLTAPDGAERLASAALDALGGLDVLVNNAGSQIVHERVEQFTDDEWQQDLAINLLAPIRLDRALLPALADGGGSIIHVSSAVARTPEPAVIAYASAKAALAVYSKGLAKQVGADGVRVNSVFPGFTATDMFVSRFQAEAEQQGQDYDEFVAALMGRFGVPLGRPGSPEEVAAVIAFLASPESSYVTGTQTMVEGGFFPAAF